MRCGTSSVRHKTKGGGGSYDSGGEGYGLLRCKLVRTTASGTTYVPLLWKGVAVTLALLAAWKLRSRSFISNGVCTRTAVVAPGRRRSGHDGRAVLDGARSQPKPVAGVADAYYDCEHAYIPTAPRAQGHTSMVAQEHRRGWRRCSWCAWLVESSTMRSSVRCERYIYIQHPPFCRQSLTPLLSTMSLPAAR